MPLRWPAAAALAATGGLLHTASFSPTGAWPLQILGLVLLVLALEEAGTARRAAWVAWLFALCWLASGLWWLFISMHRYGGIAAPLAVVAVVLLAAALALYYALAAAVWARMRTFSALLNAALFAACWLLAELARGVLFTGFPWIAGGYAHTDGPLAVWAPWIGVYGIGALAAWTAAAAAGAWTLRLQPARAAAMIMLPLAVAAGGLALPNQFTSSNGPLSVTLLQSDVAQDLKFEPARIERVLQWHRDALAAARGSLVLTPESSIPLPLGFLDGQTLAALRAPFTHGDRAALVGIFTGSDAVGYTNSVIGLSATSDPADAASTYYRYGKRHLLPFGEFIPPGFGWFVHAMNIPIGDQARGTSILPLVVAGQRVRPLICYEDLFAEDIVDSVVGDDGATVLANTTNLAWFGAVMVQDQHLQFSRMRALELQRPIVRATNTGATAAVDHLGQVVARLPPLVVGALETQVEGRIGATPYARWLARWGLWPLALCAVAVLGAAVMWRRRGATP
jgi:apolipoprotein N-acyltransferase